MNTRKLKNLLWGLSAVSAAAVIFSGCGQRPPGGFQMPPPEVGVVTITPESVALTTELPGRIDPVRVAEVRARVTGIVLHREFSEGAEVTNGEVLYQIDPAPFKAALDSANANLMQAQLLVQRYKPLVDINAVSKQDYDNAVSAAAQAKASQEIAAINLGYCTVTAPISGRVGAALVTEGALVSQSTATEMAVVQQLDPIYCDFTESSTEVLRLRRELENGALKSIAPGEAKVTLLLDDGTTYQHPGKLLFSDVTVDPSSGMITLRAEFPNPDHLLLPGMFARGLLEQAVDAQAITVIQRGVSIGANGIATAMVVGADGKVESRVIKIGSAVGNKWVVTEGLKAGERIIVEGLQKVQPGMVVKPVPFGSGSAGILPASSKSGAGEARRQDGGAPGKEGN
ncbi:MAG: efflux RND transporter periplasmic adaptor subunit [Verrucomicrobiota bacterium]